MLSQLEQRDDLDFRVSPHELTVDEVPAGRGATDRRRARAPFHCAGIAQVTIERAASTRELTRFARPARVHRSSSGAPEPLGDARRARRQSHRAPAGVPARSSRRRRPDGPVAALVGEQRARHEEMFSRGGPVSHLYPPDKGWVRLDRPATRFSSVSLVDLALLVDDPSSLASMLLRLTDDEADTRRRQRRSSRSSVT